MFIQIAPRAKVYVTDLDVEFIKQNYTKPFKGSSLSKENAIRAKMLADKSVFVRKKLDDDVQYALNRKIKFIVNESK